MKKIISYYLKGSEVTVGYDGRGILCITIRRKGVMISRVYPLSNENMIAVQIDINTINTIHLLTSNIDDSQMERLTLKHDIADVIMEKIMTQYVEQNKITFKDVDNFSYTAYYASLSYDDFAANDEGFYNVISSKNLQSDTFNIK